MSTKPSDIDILECYIEPQRRKYIAANLLTFGYRLFKTATIIQNLDKIISHYGDDNRKLSDFPNKFPTVLFDSLLDAIRISICFENYFKVKLLLNGFIIHNIDKNKNKSLSKKQMYEPIGVNEMITSHDLIGLAVLKDMLTETTINYGLILKNPNYLKYLNVENDIDFLAEINKKRNRLHLLTSETTSLSKKILNQYNSLNKIADIDIAILQNTLLNELDPESKNKLQVRI